MDDLSEKEKERNTHGKLERKRVRESNNTPRNSWPWYDISNTSLPVHSGATQYFELITRGNRIKTSKLKVDFKQCRMNLTGKKPTWSQRATLNERVQDCGTDSGES